MPRPGEDARRAFLALVPVDPDVTSRPMFGQVCAFVNGTMFMGLFGDRLFVRMGDAERARVLARGGADFTSKGYVLVPEPWQDRPDEVRGWVASALELGRALPARTSRRD